MKGFTTSNSCGLIGHWWVIFHNNSAWWGYSKCLCYLPVCGYINLFFTVYLGLLQKIKYGCFACVDNLTCVRVIIELQYSLVCVYPFFHSHWNFYANVYVIYVFTKYQTSYVVESTGGNKCFCNLFIFTSVKLCRFDCGK